MSLTSIDIFALRNCVKLPLPKTVQDNIARLRITPAQYKPVRHITKPRNHHHHHAPRILQENWRERVLVEYVSKIKDKDDPDYFEVFSIFNKLAPSNMDLLSKEAITIIQKRDEQFRLRITTLLFDKAISDNIFASVMADCALKLSEPIPEVKEDLNTQIRMFSKLYNMEETVVFPSAEDPEFDAKVVNWMKQKTKRRGYSKFMTQLFVRKLVPEDLIQQTIQSVFEDLNETAKKKKIEQTEENVTHFVDFLFECAKILPPTCTELRSLIRNSATEFLKIPRPDVPSLCMRSRFKLEDAVKCVQ